MKPSIVVGGARVFLGDCRDVLKSLPDNSVDSVVTDPPYELGFMGKSWDNSGIAYDVTVWSECLRVLKPGGHLLAFGGSRTYHRLGVAIEDAGFEIRDTIAWISSKTFPKSLNVSKAIDKKLGAVRDVVGTNKAGSGLGLLDRKSTIGGNFDLTTAGSLEGKQWEGWGTGLKQVVEPVVMARKPLDGTVAENTLEWGVGGLNIDGSRIGSKNRVNQPASSLGNAHTLSGGKAQTDLTPNQVQGRWPANVILDEVSAGLLDEQSGVLKSGDRSPTKQRSVAEYNFNDTASTVNTFSGDKGGASRFFYVAKASKRDRNEGLEDLEQVHANNFAQDKWTMENMSFVEKPRQNFHPTVKPTQLMRYLIKLVTPEGGTVLDPFTGSGSTGKAALLDGYQFIGAELTEEYLPIIEGRLRWALEQEGDDDDTLF